MFMPDPVDVIITYQALSSIDPFQNRFKAKKTTTMKNKPVKQLNQEAGQVSGVGDEGSTTRNGCHRCEDFQKELKAKDETIRKLTDTLEVIHEFSASQLKTLTQPQVPVVRKRKRAPKVNVSLGAVIKTLSRPRRSSAKDKAEKENDAALKSQKRQSSPVNPEADVITLQEIIDKAVEHNPNL